MPDSSIPIIKLDRKHPHWDSYHDVWDQLELLHEGGIKLKRHADIFLAKKPKELFDVYQERVRRFVYQNLVGNCVGWYIVKLFQREPVIDLKVKDDSADAFMLDCDRAGTTFVDFFRRVFQCQILYRMAFVLIDKPRADQAPIPIRTRADEKQAGMDRPNLVLYSPQQVINWAADDYGNLNWIVIKFLQMEQADAFGDVIINHYWCIYDRQNFYVYEYQETKKPGENKAAALFDESGNFLGKDAAAMATLKVEGKHVLASESRVPVHVLEVPDSLWLANRAYLHLCDHVDTENTHAWKLFMCNLPLLVIKGEMDMSTVTVSETAFLHLTEKDSAAEYLEPQATTFKESQARLDSLREEIYRDFYLQAQARTSTATAQGASGFSKQQDMAPANDVLNGFGDRLRAGMQNVLKDVKLVMGLSTDADPDVNGFRFQVKPFMEEIEPAQALLDSGVTDKSPTLEFEVDKRLAMDWADDLNQDTKDKIISELKSAPTRMEAAEAQQQQEQQAFQQSFQKMTNRNLVKSEVGAAEAA